ncbi:zf-HC2 domain-containing protein [candidate division WOR-3 bacterium]|nr:zf-HC2 domain-containing protein [candidate division WOR-3 bacterium]
MNCKKVEELLSSYIDGELERDDIIKVESHIKECSECKAKLEHYQSIKEMVKSIEIPSPSYRVERNIIGYARRRNYFLRFIFSTSLLTGLGALLILTFGHTAPPVVEKPKEYYMVKEEKNPYMEIVYEKEGNYILTNYEGGSF